MCWNWSKRFLKTLIIISCVGLGVCGVLSMALGIAFRRTMKDIDPPSDTGPNYITFKAIWITCGICMVVLAASEVYACVKESETILFVLAITVATIAACTLSFFLYTVIELGFSGNADYFQDALVEGLQAKFDDYNKTKQAEDFVNQLQENRACCGMKDVSTWKEIPKSCCDPKSELCTADKAYKDGCLKAVHTRVMWILLFANLAVLVGTFNLIKCCVYGALFYRVLVKGERG